MKNYLLYFVDNINRAIELQKEYLEKEIESHDNDDLKVHPIFDKKKKCVKLGQEMNIFYDGKSITINGDTADQAIEEFIQNNIIKLFSNRDTIQFVVDCNLDDEDKRNTSYKFVENLFKIAVNETDKIIITIVSAHYHTNTHIEEVLNKLSPDIYSNVKFLSRPMNNNLDKYYWDENQSSNGRYNIGNIIYSINREDRKYQIIEELLYDNSSSANYFGILLSRFLKNKKIENNI